MIFNIPEEILVDLSDHLYKLNQKQGGTYYLNKAECNFFENLLHSENKLTLIYVIFIIANCIKEELYEEELIIGYFRDYLKANIHNVWSEIVLLSKISPKFLQFVLDSWELDFEEEKYQFLEKMKI